MLSSLLKCDLSLSLSLQCQHKCAKKTAARESIDSCIPVTLGGAMVHTTNALERIQLSEPCDLYYVF